MFIWVTSGGSMPILMCYEMQAPHWSQSYFVDSQCGEHITLSKVHSWVVQCSAVMSSTVQCMTVQYIAAQCNTLQCSAIRCSAVQYFALQCIVIKALKVHHHSVTGRDGEVTGREEQTKWQWHQLNWTTMHWARNGGEKPWILLIGSRIVKLG